MDAGGTVRREVRRQRGADRPSRTAFAGPAAVFTMLGRRRPAVGANLRSGEVRQRVDGLRALPQLEVELRLRDGTRGTGLGDDLAERCAMAIAEQKDLFQKSLKKPDLLNAEQE